MKIVIRQNHKKFFLLFLVLILSTFYLPQKAFSSCAKSGTPCGDPPFEGFPECCPYNTNSEGTQTQVPLKCSGVDNGIGTCEEDIEENKKEE